MPGIHIPCIVMRGLLAWWKAKVIKLIGEPVFNYLFPLYEATSYVSGSHIWLGWVWLLWSLKGSSLTISCLKITGMVHHRFFLLTGLCICVRMFSRNINPKHNLSSARQLSCFYIVWQANVDFGFSLINFCGWSVRILHQLHFKILTSWEVWGALMRMFIFV